jgi:hypothetical protein
MKAEQMAELWDLLKGEWSAGRTAMPTVELLDVIMVLNLVEKKGAW